MAQLSRSFSKAFLDSWAPVTYSIIKDRPKESAHANLNAIHQLYTSKAPMADGSGHGTSEKQSDSQLLFLVRCLLSRHKNLEATFGFFDVDGDGTVTKMEFRRGLMSLQVQGVTEEDVGRLCDDADVDGNGEIEYAEFLGCMARQKEDAEEEVAEMVHVKFKTLPNVWRSWIQNRRTTLSRAHFFDGLKGLGMGLTDRQMTILFNATDSKCDGVIDATEFWNRFRTKKEEHERDLNTKAESIYCIYRRFSLTNGRMDQGGLAKTLDIMSGCPYNKTDAIRVMKQLDANKVGTITYLQMCQVLENFSVVDALNVAFVDLFSSLICTFEVWAVAMFGSRMITEDSFRTKLLKLNLGLDVDQIKGLFKIGLGTLKELPKALTPASFFLLFGTSEAKVQWIGASLIEALHATYMNVEDAWGEIDHHNRDKLPIISLAKGLLSLPHGLSHSTVTWWLRSVCADVSGHMTKSAFCELLSPSNLERCETHAETGEPLDAPPRLSPTYHPDRSALALAAVQAAQNAEVAANGGLDQVLPVKESIFKRAVRAVISSNANKGSTVHVPAPPTPSSRLASPCVSRPSSPGPSPRPSRSSSPQRVSIHASPPTLCLPASAKSAAQTPSLVTTKLQSLSLPNSNGASPCGSRSSSPRPVRPGTDRRFSLPAAIMDNPALTTPVSPGPARSRACPISPAPVFSQVASAVGGRRRSLNIVPTSDNSVASPVRVTPITPSGFTRDYPDVPSPSPSSLHQRRKSVAAPPLPATQALSSLAGAPPLSPGSRFPASPTSTRTRPTQPVSPSPRAGFPPSSPSARAARPPPLSPACRQPPLSPSRSFAASEQSPRASNPMLPSMPPTPVNVLLPNARTCISKDGHVTRLTSFTPPSASPSSYDHRKDLDLVDMLLADVAAENATRPPPSPRAEQLRQTCANNPTPRRASIGQAARIAVEARKVDYDLVDFGQPATPDRKGPKARPRSCSLPADTHPSSPGGPLSPGGRRTLHVPVPKGGSSRASPGDLSPNRSRSPAATPPLTPSASRFPANMPSSSPHSPDSASTAPTVRARNASCPSSPLNRLSDARSPALVPRERLTLQTSSPLLIAPPTGPTADRAETLLEPEDKTVAGCKPVVVYPSPAIARLRFGAEVQKRCSIQSPGSIPKNFDNWEQVSSVSPQQCTPDTAQASNQDGTTSWTGSAWKL